MKTLSPGAVRALLLIALPFGAVAASAQTLRSGVTTFDKDGNPTTFATAPGGGTSITAFDRFGNPTIVDTTPPGTNFGVSQPPNVAGIIANQNLYSRFNYGYQTPYPYGGAYYQAPGYGYPAPGYGYPATNPAYTVPLGGAYNNNTGPFGPTTVTVIPGGQTYGYAPTYPYPAPVYPYPAYPYPYPTYGYGYGSVRGSYSNNSSSYGASFNENGLRISVGGSNSSGSSYSTTHRR